MVVLHESVNQQRKQIRFSSDMQLQRKVQAILEKEG